MTLEQFMRMEGQGGFQQLGGPPGAEQGDTPLSTHPSAINRLRRLAQVFSGSRAK